MKNESNWEAKMKNSSKCGFVWLSYLCLSWGSVLPYPPRLPTSGMSLRRESATAAGTMNDPWDLQTALGQGAWGGSSLVKPGDTIWLRGGTYVYSGDTDKWCILVVG